MSDSSARWAIHGGPMTVKRSLFLALSVLAAGCGDSGDSNPNTAVAGTVGTAGVGVSGTGTGVAGASSVAGIGTAGPMGTAGTVPMSTAGAMGSAGVTGAAGAGAAGVMGAAGSMGTAGVMGSAGAAGSTGGAMAGGGGTGGSPVVDGGLFTVQAQLASDVQPSAPGTIGIVTWSTTLPSVTDAHLDFGLDDSYGTQAPVDLAEADYRTLLLGLKPSRTYHFRVVASDGTSQHASDDYTIDTGPPNTSIDIDYQILDAAAHAQGFVVSSTRANTGASYAFILDADGEVVWWHDFGTQGIARARMSADGKNMWMTITGLSGAPIQRVTMDALDGQSYPSAIGSHDLTPVSGATMAFLEYGETDCDSIFEIDPSGTMMEVFESDPIFGGGGGGGPLPGGCHSNALRYLSAENVYTFSDLTQDIIRVDRAGAVVWRLSELLPGGIATLGARHHGNQTLQDSILVFANDAGGPNSSAALEFSLADGSEIFRYVSGEFTANLGDVQRLPGGNTLVTYSNSGLVHEVDANGILVMQYRGVGVQFGYSLFRQSLYGPPPDIAQ